MCQATYICDLCGGQTSCWPLVKITGLSIHELEFAVCCECRMKMRLIKRRFGGEIFGANKNIRPKITQALCDFFKIATTGPADQQGFSTPEDLSYSSYLKLFSK